MSLLPGVRNKSLLPILHYQGTTPSTCKESGRTYWTTTLTQTSQSPCNLFPRGSVCWTYLAQAGSSDGGGVQDTALRDIAATRIAVIAQATPPQPRYRRAQVPDPRCFTFTKPLPYCAPPGNFLSYEGGLLFRCRGANDTDTGCILTFIFPSTSQYTDLQFQSQISPSHRACGAAFIPFLIGAGIFTGVSAGASGLGTSIDFYYKLSQELNDDMERVADSLTSLQTQLSSLAAVVLQNRRALNLLTAEKCGTCLFLQEECCYYMNQSGIIATKVRELRDHIQHHREELASWGFGSQSWTSWVLPLAGPLLSIFLPATIGPCIFNALVRFIENTVSHLTTARILALQGYRPLSLNDDLQGSPSNPQRGDMLGRFFSCEHSLGSFPRLPLSSDTLSEQFTCEHSS
ncbi:hypothetical protein mRhiFer1_007971 [Rhinolophus ferrumequinum]|uniref:Uncharacterized protein n=1 Tax=Rhinolophus ferrumequinum TaxID=59479 RepID=A0A7J8AW17_RHIFE|nr:hypothetical protein mRhiFer1_007971 [Rhinolophus ferrumequinum]